jgi:hypothetical protein
MKKTILIAAVMFFAFSVAAFAQASFQVASTPVISVASCGTTEMTGDIAFTQVFGSLPITTGTITVNYGVAISTVAGASMRVFDSTGTQIGTAQALTPPSLATPNLLSLAITPPATGTAPYTIRISGVRVNIAGNSQLTSLSATVTSTGNLFVGGQTNVLVISSISSAIGSIDDDIGTIFVPNHTALKINAVAATGFGTVQVDVNEGFANAFVPGQIVGLTFSSIPNGLSLDSFPAQITDDAGTVFDFVDENGGAATPGALTSTSTALTIYYKVSVAGGNDAVVENLRIPIAVSKAFGAPSPLPQGTVTVMADLYPKLGPFPDVAGSKIPQYSGTSCQKGPLTIITVQAGSTSLLIPYATTAAGYNTGIAISNTTTDPFTGNPASAVKQNGTITFYFYPQTGAKFQYPAAGGTLAVGGGLTAGVLNSGGLYTVLLSELLAAANAPADFSGYIVAVCTFTNGHGQYFITDFEAFTNGALMVVIGNDRRTAPETLGN